MKRTIRFVGTALLLFSTQLVAEPITGAFGVTIGEPHPWKPNALVLSIPPMQTSKYVKSERISGFAVEFSELPHTKRIYKIKATETLHHTDRNPYDLKDKSHISKAAYDRCKNIRSALITHLTNKYGEHIVPGENQTPSFVDAETNNSITIERCSLGYISRNLRNTARSTYTVIYLNSALESALPSERTLEDEERKKATDSRRLNNIKQNF